MVDIKEIAKDYIDQVTAAKMLNLSQSRVSQLCTEGRFEGASKIGWSWLIPKVSVERFQPLKRGPKSTKNISVKEIISEVLEGANK